MAEKNAKRRTLLLTENESGQRRLVATMWLDGEQVRTHYAESPGGERMRRLLEEVGVTLPGGPVTVESGRRIFDLLGAWGFPGSRTLSVEAV